MDSYLQLFDHVGQLARQRYLLAERRLASLAMTHTEARLLSLLNENDHCRQETLAAKIIIDRSNVGRALKRLEQQDYLARKKDPQDKRSYLINITTKGRQQAARIAEIRKTMAKELFADLPKKELNTIVEILNNRMPL